jgi:hypothetical protein
MLELAEIDTPTDLAAAKAFASRQEAGDQGHVGSALLKR